MKQRFLISLTAILLITASSATKAIASQERKFGAFQAPSNQLTFCPLPCDLCLVAKGLDQQENLIATVYAYKWEESIAATLYVRNLPVLTFLSAPQTSTNQKKFREIRESDRSSGNYESIPRQDLRQSHQDPIERAQIVASRLNQLYRENLDASKIKVSWNAPSQSYNINIDDEKLVTVDRTTILADTTKNLAKDALQATNRLRRLMGNAPPLKEIAGQPKPKPAPRQVATMGAGINDIRKVRGIASWYGPGFHGRLTANGEKYNQNAFTAAHPNLAFGTRVRVTNLNNGRSTIVRINDRGPYIAGRIIDLSAAAARAIGMLSSGVAPVRLEIISRAKTD
ncbi:MAG: septal ring lytic transglycosylase RlpA family protein [Prochloraceae cyanobacterium]